MGINHVIASRRPLIAEGETENDTSTPPVAGVLTHTLLQIGLTTPS